MKKVNPSFFVIELPVYNIDICVSYLQLLPQMIKSMRKKYNISTSDEEIIKSFPDWAAGTMGDFGIGGPILIRINEGQDLVRTISHEVFHAVAFIARSRGLEYCDKSEEAFAYLIGHLNSEVINHLLKRFK
jgi:hypothetical protein